MCPFSQGRAHFGKISALELNGQHTGRTNHRHLYSAHPILQIGSKRMGCGVKVNGVRECWKSCHTLNADMHQAVSPAETEVLTFIIDRLPESDSLFQKAEDTTLPVLRLSPTLALSMVSLGFASLLPQSPILTQSESLYISPSPKFLLQDVSFGGQWEGNSFLRGIWLQFSQEELVWMPSTLKQLNEISSCQVQPRDVLSDRCVFHWNRWYSPSRWVTRRPMKFLQGVRKSL